MTAVVRAYEGGPLFEGGGGALRPDKGERGRETAAEEDEGGAGERYLAGMSEGSPVRGAPSCGSRAARSVVAVAEIDEEAVEGMEEMRSTSEDGAMVDCALVQAWLVCEQSGGSRQGWR